MAGPEKLLRPFLDDIIKAGERAASTARRVIKTRVNGRPITIVFEDAPDYGFRSVDWGFGHKNPDAEDFAADIGERLSVADTRAILARVRDETIKDSQITNAPSYQFSPISNAHERLYSRLSKDASDFGYEASSDGLTLTRADLGEPGLDMSHAARMKRAEGMGFDTSRPLYHGTAQDFESFDAGKFGGATKARSARQGVWTVNDPGSASGYAEHAETKAVQDLIDASYAAEARGDWDAAHDLMARAERLEQSGGAGGGNVLPLYGRGRIKDIDMDGAKYDPDDHDLTTLVREARSEGFDGVRFVNFSDEAGYGNYNPADHTIIFDPSNIRSVNAAFDPAKSDSANLLASYGPAGVLGAGSLAALSGTERAEAAPPDGPGQAERDVRAALGPIQTDEIPRFRYEHPFEYGAGPGGGDPNRVGPRLEGPRGTLEALLADAIPQGGPPGFPGAGDMVSGMAGAVGREMDIIGRDKWKYPGDLLSGWFAGPLREEADYRREGVDMINPDTIGLRDWELAELNRAREARGQGEIDRTVRSGGGDPDAQPHFVGNPDNRFYDAVQNSASQSDFDDAMDLLSAGFTPLDVWGGGYLAKQGAEGVARGARSAAQLVDDVLERTIPAAARLRGAAEAAPGAVRDATVDAFRASRRMYDQLPAALRQPLGPNTTAGIRRRDAARVRDAIPDTQPTAANPHWRARQANQRDFRAAFDDLANPDIPAGTGAPRLDEAEALLRRVTSDDLFSAHVFPGRRTDPDKLINGDVPTGGVYLQDVLDDRPFLDRAAHFVNPMTVGGGGLAALLASPLLEGDGEPTPPKRTPDPRMDIIDPMTPPRDVVTREDLGFAGERRELDVARTELERRRRERPKADTPTFRTAREVVDEILAPPAQAGGPPVAPGTEAGYDLTSLSGEDLRLPTVTPERGAVYGEDSPFRYGVREQLGNNKPNNWWSDRERIEEWRANPPLEGQQGLDIAEGDPTLSALADLVQRRWKADTGAPGYGPEVRAWITDKFGIDPENATAEQRSEILRALATQEPDAERSYEELARDLQRILKAADLDLGDYGGGTGIDGQIGDTTKRNGMAPWMRQRGATERQIKEMMETDFSNEEALRAWVRRWVYETSQ